MKQLEAKIASNKKAGTCFYLMKLESDYLAKNSRPGQFVEIQCTKSVDPLLRRPLGVHRIVSDGIEILYEVVGRGTELLAGKRQGETLSIIGPLGNGFEPVSGEGAILIAGGIGQAPLLALAERLADGKKLQVLIGAKTESHILCEKDFKRLGCKVFIATDDGSKGHKGLVTDLLKDTLNAAIYACGPTGMLKAVSRIARTHGVPCQVSLEERMACGVGVCLGCPVKVKTGEYKMVCKDGPVFDSEEVVWE